MKYDRKAIIAAIIKLQKEKFIEEEKELSSKLPSLATELKEATTEYLFQRSRPEIFDSLKNAQYFVSIDNYLGEPTGARINLNVSDHTSEAFKNLKKAYDAYRKVSAKLRDIEYYLYSSGSKHNTNLTEKVEKEVPYGYEIKANMLVKNPDLAEEIEAIRKDIFKD